MTNLQFARNGADFSDDRVYRYRLWREWDDSLPSCLFVMLNPSTADATQDDPTIAAASTTPGLGLRRPDGRQPVRSVRHQPRLNCTRQMTRWEDRPTTML